MTKSKAPPITIGMVLILFTALSLIFAYSCECPAQTPTPAPTAEPSATPEKTPTPRIITPTPTPEICTRLDEGFDGFETGTRPAGWTFINCDQNADTYTTAGNFGHLSPSIRLDATGDIIETNLSARAPGSSSGSRDRGPTPPAICWSKSTTAAAGARSPISTAFPLPGL